VSGNGNSFEIWGGGAYELSFGSAYISYCESAFTEHGELFSYLDSNGGSWIGGVNTFSNQATPQCWDDSTYSVAVADYMPTSLQDKVGI
jgi:hypothetical protein